MNATSVFISQVLVVFILIVFPVTFLFAVIRFLKILYPLTRDQNPPPPPPYGPPVKIVFVKISIWITMI